MGIRLNIEDIRFGIRGVNLKDALDVLDATEASRLNNLYHNESGQLTNRPGYSLIGSAGTNVNTIGRLNAKTGTTFARLYGIDTNLYIGQNGSPSLLSGGTGFSGNPMSFTPARPPLSGESWMLVGDSQQMVKVDIDGLLLPIGLPAPVNAAVPGPAQTLEKTIEPFDSTTGFTPHALTAPPPPGSTGTPNTPVLGVVTGPNGGPAINMATSSGSATGGYISYFDKAIGPIDLTQFAAPGDSTLDDFIHLFLKVDAPESVSEIRLYFITANFLDGVIPGNDPANSTDAFMKSFRPNDLTTLVQQETTSVPAATTTVNTNDISSTPQPQVTSIELNVSAGAWTEFGGIIGSSLRKSDFVQIGNPDWSKVQAILIWVATADTSSINLSIDDLYMSGGYGLDDVVTGTSPYNWRYTNYDPRTGAESNPSPEIDAITDGVNASRQGFNIGVSAYGNPAIMQRIYRQGGTLVDDWYLAGTNTSDGAPFFDTNTDDDLRASATVEIDHYQPIPTVDDLGNTILAQPVRSLWGPINGYHYACGDPYRPGFLYWCKPGQPDHWSPDNTDEVCSGTEILVNGCIFGDRAFVISTKRVYAIYPNLQGTGNSVTPTGCAVGLAAFKGIAISPTSFFIVSFDGIYPTNGQTAGQPLSDNIRPLFHGQTVNGYPPIDWSFSDQITLEYFDNDLWFGFQSTTGSHEWWVYSLLYRYWRHYSFAETFRTIYNEVGSDRLSLLMGSALTGNIELFGAADDGGSPIQWTIRTGALNQGRPREYKRYGDLSFDINPMGSSLLVTVYSNYETTTLASESLPTANQWTHYIINPFNELVYELNLSVNIDGTGPAVLYLGTLSYLVEPADYVRWQTSKMDHGIPGWQVPLKAHICIRSTADVTLTRRAFNQEGTLLLQDTYTLPSTGDHKTRLFVPFQSIKGTLFDYIFTSPSRFRVYDQESTVMVYPWGTQSTSSQFSVPLTPNTNPFGTESDMRTGVNPVLAAQRSGGSQ